jgi:hypothetical protein
MFMGPDLNPQAVHELSEQVHCVMAVTLSKWSLSSESRIADLAGRVPYASKSTLVGGILTRMPSPKRGDTSMKISKKLSGVVAVQGATLMTGCAAPLRWADVDPGRSNATPGSCELWSVQIR